jgi:tRNA A-37 threonylcarbamoyl transferase component Bud32
MFEQKGGVKLSDTSLTGFTPIQQMLDSPDATLKVLTASSLKGFMLTLDVTEENSKYLTQDTKKNFTVPATSFILKYVVITDDAGETLSDYTSGSKVVRKASESANSFYNEAILQQEIWESSVQGNKEAICPPVANFSMFDHNSSIALLERQNQKYQNPIIRYLLHEVKTISPIRNGNYRIGILTMPKIESVTLYDFLDNNPDTALKKKMYSSAIAKLVRLFVDSTKTFHFDLHGGNVLVMDDGECIIIDFGNAFRFAENDKKEQDLLFQKCGSGTRGQINNLLKDCHDFSEVKFDEYFRVYNRLEKIRYIESILEQLKIYERTITQFVYGKSYYQMSWLDDVSKLDFNDIYLKAFNMLGIEAARPSSHNKRYYTKLREGNPITETLLTSLPPAAPSAGPLISNVPKTSSGGEWVCKMVAGAAVCTFVAAKAFGFFGGKSKRNKRKRTRKTKRRR